MERLVITIHPAPNDEGRLRVTDAMQQVLDVLKLHEEAERAVASPDEAFDWRLERASTNSPLMVVAVAEPRIPNANVDAHVRRVKARVSSAVRGLLVQDRPEAWMTPDIIGLARGVFARTQNGIGATEIELAPGETIAIGRKEAAEGLRAISGLTAVSLESELSARQAWGEVQGVMEAAGRYMHKPALQIRTEQYGYVWCRLSAELVERFGGEHQLTEVWAGKSLGIEGDLVYSAGGKLARIEATAIRELVPPPPIDLASVQDPEFTGGLDPVEYLRQLWEGHDAS